MLSALSKKENFSAERNPWAMVERVDVYFFDPKNIDKKVTYEEGTERVEAGAVYAHVASTQNDNQRVSDLKEVMVEMSNSTIPYGSAIPQWKTPSSPIIDRLSYWGFGKAVKLTKNDSQLSKVNESNLCTEFSVKSYVVIEKAALDVLTKLSEERVKYVQKTLDNLEVGAENTYIASNGSYIPDMGQFVPVTWWKTTYGVRVNSSTETEHYNIEKKIDNAELLTIRGTKENPLD